MSSSSTFYPQSAANFVIFLETRSGIQGTVITFIFSLCVTSLRGMVQHPDLSKTNCKCKFRIADNN